MTQPLIDALVGMIEYVTKGQVYRAKNHYSQKPVVEALKVLGVATGHATSGYDYLDVVDKILKERESVQTNT